MRQEGPLIDQLTPSLAVLLDLFRPCFRQEVFSIFRLMTAAWVVCLGRHTVSRVWQTTGREPCHRLHLWTNWLTSEPGGREGKLAWLLEYLATAA
jgi:hypothetical protein